MEGNRRSQPNYKLRSAEVDREGREDRSAGEKDRDYVVAVSGYEDHQQSYQKLDDMEELEV